MTGNGIILLFVKVPGRGAVKTRLVRYLHEDFVRTLYENMVLDTIDTAKGSGLPFRISFAPADAHEEVRTWLGPGYEYVPQTGDDLGERMEQAFESVFSGGADRAILIGSDIPGLTSAIIREAFHNLASHDSVIGPANDGGYYLIGFTRSGFSPVIFRDMLWSTESVFRETVCRLHASSRTYHVLPECIDADTTEDLALFLDQNEGRDDSSRTLALLRQHRDLIRERKHRAPD